MFMPRKITLWQAVLAVSIALALALPAFAQGQGKSPGSSGTSSTSPYGGASMQPSEQMGKAMGDKAATPADRTLNQRIRQIFNEDATLAASAQNIYIETDNGEVTLHGLVTTEKAKADIVAKVQQVAGVKKVNNQLQTASE